MSYVALFTLTPTFTDLQSSYERYVTAQPAYEPPISIPAPPWRPEPFFGMRPSALALAPADLIEGIIDDPRQGPGNMFATGWDEGLEEFEEIFKIYAVLETELGVKEVYLVTPEEDLAGEAVAYSMMFFVPMLTEREVYVVPV